MSAERAATRLTEDGYPLCDEHALVHAQDYATTVDDLTQPLREAGRRCFVCAEEAEHLVAVRQSAQTGRFAVSCTECGELAAGEYPESRAQALARQHAAVFSGRLARAGEDELGGIS